MIMKKNLTVIVESIQILNLVDIFQCVTLGSKKVLIKIGIESWINKTLSIFG